MSATVDHRTGTPYRSGRARFLTCLVVTLVTLLGLIVPALSAASVAPGTATILEEAFGVPLAYDCDGHSKTVHYVSAVSGTSTTLAIQPRAVALRVERSGAGGLRSSTYSGSRGRATKGGPAATGNAGRIDDLTRQAAEQYPNLAGKVHKHHVTPKYLGGQADGPLVEIDAAYHQLITNEFRRLAPYGGPRPGAARLEEVQRQVYNKYRVGGPA